MNMQMQLFINFIKKKVKRSRKVYKQNKGTCPLTRLGGPVGPLLVVNQIRRFSRPDPGAPAGGKPY